MRSLLPILAVFGVFSASAGQTQAPVPLRAESRLVVVDAVVTRKGASVSGLEAKDFHVFEDGKEQPVKGFSSTTGPATPGISRKRYFVLFFDYTVGWDRQKVLKDAEKFIADNAGPDRLMAVAVFAGDLKIAQTFTADTGALLDAVRHLEVKPPTLNLYAASGSSVREAELRLRALGGSLGFLAKNLTDIPGRKAMVAFSTGAGADDFDHVGQASMPALQTLANGNTDKSRDPYRMIQPLRKANVAVYPIATEVAVKLAGWLEDLSFATGGRPIYRGNDVLLAMDEVAREQDESYSLGYVPAESPEGSCHELKVTVDQPGVKVRARDLYCNTKPVNLVAMNPLEKELESLAASASGGAGGASLAAPFFFVGKDVARVNVALEIPSPAFSVRRKGGKLHADLDVLGLAYTMAGGVAARFSDKVGYDFDTQQEFDSLRQKPLQYGHQFDVASGNYTFKVVYRSAKDSFGKVEAPLAVDLYDPTRLSLSAIALSREVRPVAASDGVDAVLDEGQKPLVFRGTQIVVSATDRLARSGLVETYIEVYEPLLKEKNPVQLGLRVRLLDGASGEQKWDSGNVNLSGLAQAGNPVVPVALRLPVAGLAPGAYRAEFTVEDSAGARAMRDAEFRLE